MPNLSSNIPASHPTDVSIITTYRCQMRCKMCDIWENPTDQQREITAKDLEILPNFKFVNITGGEPFVRRDLEDIVEVMFRKSPRIVISTSGWHTERIFRLAEKFPNIGVRVSIEGLSQKNDELRGRDGSFDRGLRVLMTLKEMGLKDIGYGCTVSNHNSADMLWLHKLSRELGMEFATAAFHNSYYFHKDDNVITNKDEVIANFRKLIEELLKENSPKSWYRAFFNLGLINYIRGKPRMLPCEAGSANFFVDPYGEVFPCNGLEDRYWKESMGNIRECADFDALWNSDQAQHVRGLVRTCPKNCWMVGTAAPVMKKYLRHPTGWVVRNKIKSLLSKPICIDDMPYYDVGQDSRQGDLRPGTVAGNPAPRKEIVVLTEAELADMLKAD
jgi:Fe-coproporphyrin III synthase